MSSTSAANWLRSFENQAADAPGLIHHSRTGSGLHSRHGSGVQHARTVPQFSTPRPRLHPYDADPDRKRWRRVRLPLFAALAVVGVLLWIVYLFFSETEHDDSALTSTERLRKALSRPLVRTNHKVPVIDVSKSPFYPSSDPLPVHHTEADMIYHNYPLSKHRPPANQFLLSPNADFDEPVVAIITATNNPRREMMLESAASLFGQSLQNFIWVIVSDHTDDAESNQVLDELKKDPRVTVLKNTGLKGLPQGRNVALDYVYELPELPKYWIPLDDDDLFEFTALEKLAWMMESNEDWSMGGFYYVKWGEGANETVTTGLHSGKDNWIHGNFVPNSVIVRTQDSMDSDCRYDEIGFHDGGEDWDYWMCLAGSGHWGGTAQEFLYWYRANPSSFRAKRWGDMFTPGGGFNQLKSHIQQKHHDLRDQFPVRVPQKSHALEPITWALPFESHLAATSKAITIIVPWLYLGGADLGALHMIQLYAEAGYRVTVVCTLHKKPEGLQLRPEVMKWTHDVHVLPVYLRANDFPRYLKHLIESRGSKEVIFSNSMLIYEMLPALVEELPHVKFIDYLHNEAYDGWKSGGYPRYSIIHQRYLARTLTCSQYLKDWLHEHGHYNPARVSVVKLGVDKAKFNAVSSTGRADAKSRLLGLEPSTIVITIVGRVDPQKRPLLVPDVVERLLEIIGEDFVILLIGEGPSLFNLRATVQRKKLEDYVITLGAKTNVHEYLEATDIFFLPSLSEGISIAVSEAMAMGLPIVTAAAGALPEQLGRDSGRQWGGVLVEHTLEHAQDVKLYAEALADLIRDAPARLSLGSHARRLLEDEDDWRQTLAALFEETKIAENLPGHASGQSDYPNPAVYTAIATLLQEDWTTTDMAGSYPNWGH